MNYKAKGEGRDSSEAAAVIQENDGQNLNLE